MAIGFFFNLLLLFSLCLEDLLAAKLCFFFSFGNLVATRSCFFVPSLGDMVVNKPSFTKLQGMI